VTEKAPGGRQADSHGKAVAVLRRELKERDIAVLIRHSGAGPGDDGSFCSIAYWGRELYVMFHDFSVVDGATGDAVDEKTEQLIIHYLHTADGTEEGPGWVSLAELPDGAFYRQAYQGYSGDHLALELQNDLDRLEVVCLEVGGKPESFGDLSYSFRVLPRLSLLMVYWRGDDEFPPSAQVHFSDTACHYLPTDICASLGRNLVDRLLEIRQG
jgi:hypothetical protein